MSNSGPNANLEPPSSPPVPPSTRTVHFSSPPRAPSARKEKRNPSVTPRKFRRFFTPRSSTRGVSSARQALQEVTGPNFLNRNGIQSSPIRPFQAIGGSENTSGPFTREMKRRKMIHTPESTQHHGDPRSKERGFLHTHNAEEERLDVPSSPCERAVRFLLEEDEEEERPVPREPPKRIVPLANRGIAGQLLSRTIRSSGRTRHETYNYPVEDWQDHTASFYSNPDDVHVCRSIVAPERVIPFCATGCNTNSLVAVGDEEGRVRLLESAKGGKPPFTDVYLAFRVHTNAIIDMRFSEDDTLLATASGDQTARVVDMSTQTTTSIFGNHSASLKQVRFQSGANNNSVLATSSRDGCIQIWDRRCNGYDGPMAEIHPPVEDTARPATRSVTRKVQYGKPVNSIYDAHQAQIRQIGTSSSSEARSRAELGGRFGIVSVTAIQFLPPGQEHLLLSASEADSSVKLWDIRSIQTKRKVSTAISMTKQPTSHGTWRHFGLSSLNLSGDGSRLYTLCKDNTVYAYSTAHLILGHAPELSSASQPRSFSKGTQEGMGPLYGFRHPQLHATSFYVKAAIRKAKDGKCEMMAVGSSDGCAILFPTDERFLPQQPPEHPLDQPPELDPSPFLTRRRSSLRRTPTALSNPARIGESIPISTNGTPLIRGHDREVGSLTWTSNGDLVTVGDDFIVRSWHEGDTARVLRTGGESEGKRWGCGWADVRAGFDDDDDC